MDEILVLNRPYHILKLIGKGGFAEVYDAKDNHGNRYAIKKIVSRKRGIPCLMEASIMSSYRHPNLNIALDIRVLGDILYIIQEIAICDVFTLIHEKKLNLSQKIEVMHSIVCALNFLHSQGIVHGDVKPENILVFPNNSYKLSDFNLSCRISWCSEDLPVCTSSYRPMEAWKGYWNEKVDQWALGCTIHYILYGNKIFKTQGDKGDYNVKLKNKGYVNALIDWEIYYNGSSSSDHYKVTYRKPELSDELFDNSILNSLIIFLLHPNHKKRPNMSEIIQMRPFNNMTRPKAKFIRLTPLHSLNILPNLSPLPLSVVLVNQPSENYNELASQLYLRYKDYATDNNKLIKEVILWMAKKITRKIEESDYDEQNINLLCKIERDICRQLNFVLH